MRYLFFLGFVLMYVLGCNTVADDACWPNTTTGAGGAGSIPIGAGVGATSGGDLSYDPPPWEPLDEDGEPNPCVLPFSPSGNGKIGDCIVTWRSDSEECKSQNGGIAICTTRYQTSKRYTDIEAVKMDCETANGVGAGSGAKACTCGWLEEPVMPLARYYCSGKVWCDNLTPGGQPPKVGVTLTRKAQDAPSEEVAKQTLLLAFAKAVHTKYPDFNWGCNQALTCTGPQPN